MAQQGRVQTRDYQNNLKLQPQARPVDTFEAPAAIPEDRNTARLIHALSSFSSSLGGLAPQLAASEKDRNKERNEAQLAERERFYMQSSPEAQRQYIIEKHGLDKSDRIQAAAIGRIDGAKAAELDQNDLLQEMQTNFDWENGDPEAYVREQLAKRLEASGRTDEPTYVSAYSRAGQSIAANIVAIRNKRLAEAQEQKVQGAAADYFRMTLDDSIKAGDDTDVSVKKFLRTAIDAGSRGTLLLDDNEVTKRQLTEIERRVSSDPDFVVKVLATGRPGKGGERASFLDDPLTRDKALDLMSKAQIVQQNRENAAEQDRVLSANVANIRNGIGFIGARDLVQTKLTGSGSAEEVVISVEKQKTEATRQFLLQDTREAQQRNETPQEMIARQVKVLSTAGLEHPDVKEAAEGLALAGSPELLSDPTQLEHVVQRVDLLNGISKANKNIGAAYLKGNDKDFFDGFIAARETLGRDDKQAAAFAYAVANPSPTAKARVTREYQSIEMAVKNLRDTKWFGRWSIDMENSGMVEDHLVDLAQKFALGGLSGKDAVAAARDAMERSAIHYNGTLIDVGALESRADMPADFRGAVEAQVAAFMEDSKGKNYSMSQLTIQQTGDRDGRFYLIDKETNRPATDDQGNMHLFTLSQLRAWSNANEKAQREAQASFNVFNQSVNAKGLFQAEDKDGSLVWINKNREIWHNTAPEGQPPVWKKTGKRYSKTIATGPDGEILLKRPQFNRPNLKPGFGMFSRKFMGALTGQSPESLNAPALGIGSLGGEKLKNTPSDNFFKFGKEAEDAINERNRGR